MSRFNSSVPDSNGLLEESHWKSQTNRCIQSFALLCWLMDFPAIGFSSICFEHLVFWFACLWCVIHGDYHRQQSERTFQNLLQCTTLEGSLCYTECALNVEVLHTVSWLRRSESLSFTQEEVWISSHVCFRFFEWLLCSSMNLYGSLWSSM